MTARHRITRKILLMLATIAAALSAALTAAAAQTTYKIVMHSDLKSFDPVWSGAYIVRNYGYMVYDVLFAMDEEFRVKPQMAESIRTSADGLTHTITLREGLTWHDGPPVTAEDCVASLKRWSARDPMGQKLADFLKEYRIIDARTFEIVLKEKFGPLLEFARQTERGRALHDAQARRRDRPVPTAQCLHRLRPVHPQAG